MDFINFQNKLSGCFIFFLDFTERNELLTYRMERQQREQESVQLQLLLSNKFLQCWNTCWSAICYRWSLTAVYVDSELYITKVVEGQYHRHLWLRVGTYQDLLFINL